MIRCLLTLALLLTLGPLGCGNEDPEAEVGDPVDSGVQVPPDTGVTPRFEPGRVVWQRLTRFEYDNTVRDLLGTRLRPAADFPDDETAFGFDSIGSVLSISPLHLELYERAADRLVADILRLPLTEPLLLKAQAENSEATTGAPYRGLAWNLWAEGEVSAEIEAPQEGSYSLQVRAWGQQAGDEVVQMELLLDSQVVASLPVNATAKEPAIYSVEVSAAAGQHVVGARFINDYYSPETAQDRQLIVDWLALEGPLDLVPPEEAPRGRVLTCTGGTECARQVLETFVPLAWRRPVESAEIDRLMGLFELGTSDGLDFDGSIGLALKGALLSPHFLFRAERSGSKVDGWAMASRLSYFLWSSMPDAELRAAAADGRLSNPAGITAQVQRMLQDPKASALSTSFAGQWLYIRDIWNHTPANWIYPEFDEALRVAMALEMERFFQTFITENRPILDLLTATDTFVNGRLASHYGFAPTEEGEPARVDTTGTARGGILSQAGLLMVTSAPGRTSPVKRGAWVLTQLLCSGPPPPPPGVEGLAKEEVEGGNKSLREILEQHQTDPSCAGCHALMDPIGFGMEHFDAIGGWRDAYAEDPIDATGELPGGVGFDGTQQLQEALAQDPRFVRCAIRQLLTYALGRQISGEDKALLDDLEQRWIADGLRFGSLVELVSTSDAFRFQGEVSE